MTDLELAVTRKEQIRANPGLWISSGDVLQLCDAIIFLSTQAEDHTRERGRLVDEKVSSEAAKLKAEEKMRDALEAAVIEKKDLETFYKEKLEVERSPVSK